MDWINEPIVNDSEYSLDCIIDCDLCFIYSCSEYKRKK